MSGSILLTGATGAVGGPLIRALLERGAGRIYALTHAAPLSEHDPRVRAVAGDVTAGEMLGLGRAHELAAEVTAIVHAAADTRFDAPLDTARRTNTLGARNVLAFAARCTRLERLIAVSTTHVAGKRTGAILEDELDHDAGFVNAYEASKFEAEQLWRDAAGRLPIAVCRLSTVIGDSRTGEIARPGALHRAVRLMYASLAPMVPGGEDSPVDLIALDYAAAAIAWLATDGFAAGATWHVSAGDDTIAAGDLLDLTIACFHEYRPAWRKRAIARPALVDLETFALFSKSVAQVGDAHLRAATDVVSHFAPQLAYPKRFDTRRCDAALAGAAIVRPAAREVWRHVVRRLVQSGPIEQAARAGDASRV